jgi:hypothetical protein
MQQTEKWQDQLSCNTIFMTITVGSNDPIGNTGYNHAKESRLTPMAPTLIRQEENSNSTNVLGMGPKFQAAYSELIDAALSVCCCLSINDTGGDFPSQHWFIS